MAAFPVLHITVSEQIAAPGQATHSKKRFWAATVGSVGQVSQAQLLWGSSGVLIPICTHPKPIFVRGSPNHRPPGPTMATPWTANG